MYKYAMQGMAMSTQKSTTEARRHGEQHKRSDLPQIYADER